MIGKLEELTLMACMRAGEKALPSEIFEFVVQGQRNAAFGAVYTTITRLADKKLVSAGERIENGRKRKAYTINAAGHAALREAVVATATIGGFPVLGGFNVAQA